MDFEVIVGGSALLLILALVELFKSAFGLNTKLAPVVAVVLGLVFSVAYSYYSDTVLFEAIIRGVIVGLSAVGIYSGTKNTIENFKG